MRLYPAPETGGRPMILHITANIDFLRGGNKAYIRHLISEYDPAVIAVQEARQARTGAKDLPLAELLPAGYTSLQDESTEDTRGSALIVRDDVKVIRHGLTLGCKPFFRGRRVKMLTRFIAWAELEFAGVRWIAVSGHAPPPRFSPLRPIFLSNLRRFVRSTKLPVAAGVDANMKIRKFGRRIGCVGYGVGIIGWAVSSPSVVTGVGADIHGVAVNWTDHPAVAAYIQPLRLTRRQTGRYIGRLRRRLSKITHRKAQR